MNRSEQLFAFVIPHTPTAKGRARSRIVKGTKGKNAGKVFASHYTPAATRDFEAVVKDFAAQAIGGAGTAPLTCPVDLLVEFHFSIPAAWPKWKREAAAAGLVHHTKKPDCSNLVKAIEDACNGVLFKDDGQVVGSIQDKAYTTGAECIVVRGYRRQGLTCQATKADLDALWAGGYIPDLRIEHLGLGHRIRTLRLVGGK